MTTASAPVKKKRPSKVASSTSSTAPATKAVKKRPSTAKVPAATTGTSKTKVSPAKATTKAAKVETSGEEDSTAPMDQYGYREGSDRSLIAHALVAGGVDRNDVNANAETAIADTNGLKGRTGKPKYIPSLVSGVLNQLLDTGMFTVQSTWALVPVDGDPVTPEPRVRTRVQNTRDKTGASAAPAKQVVASVKKTATKPRPVKKTAAAAKTTAAPAKTPVRKRRPSAK